MSSLKSIKNRKGVYVPQNARPALREVIVVAVATILALLPLAGTHAAPPRQGYQKILVRHLLALPNASAPAQLEQFGVDDLEDYDSYQLGYAPDVRLASIRVAMAGFGLSLELASRRKPLLDLCKLGRFTVHARSGRYGSR